MSAADDKLAALQDMITWRDWKNRRDDIVRAADAAGYSGREIAASMEISEPTAGNALKGHEASRAVAAMLRDFWTADRRRQLKEIADAETGGDYGEAMKALFARPEVKNAMKALKGR